MPWATPVRRIGAALHGKEGEAKGASMGASLHFKQFDICQEPHFDIFEPPMPGNPNHSKNKSNSYRISGLMAGKERCHGKMARLE